MIRKIVLLSVALSTLVLLQGCRDDNVDRIKNSNFPGYNTTTIGKMLDNAFENTKWSSQQNSKGEIVVRFEGRISKKMHDSLKGELLRFMEGDVRNSDPLWIAQKRTMHLGSGLVNCHY